MTHNGAPRNVAITGGCGFIGCNLADSLLLDGAQVTLIDNLSRPGVEKNLQWLRQRHGGRVAAEILDIRDAQAIRPALAPADAVFHLAAQTAVTTSLADPSGDFETNARGTLNILEAVRATSGAPVIFASTNKVYGSLADVETDDATGFHLPIDGTLRSRGIDETRPLDFSTPYGCSKGVADQYVIDYAKSFGMRTAVLRMSCVYGPRQFGTEDQGWVAHFLLRALAGEPITIFGDGRQVRDILYVSDAVAAYRALLEKIDDVRGQAFNVGGGPDNAVSVNAVLQAIAETTGCKPDVRHADARTGDQLYFVADTSRLEEATGWRARQEWRTGLRQLADWLGRARADETAPQRCVA
jgi:CDP-paratose 2-epimerase